MSKNIIIGFLILSLSFLFGCSSANALVSSNETDTRDVNIIVETIPPDYLAEIKGSNDEEEYSSINVETPSLTEAPSQAEPSDPAPTPSPTETPSPTPLIEDELILFDDAWEYADYTVIHNEGVVLHRAKDNRKNIVVGVDAGHGTTGASGKKLYCHPDKSKKTTGGSTAAGEIMANAQSGGMCFRDGVGEGIRTLEVSRALRDSLLEEGYDVLMLRDSEKIELDLLSRTLIANHYADCHISLHFDGDSLDYNKGAFYISVPNGIKEMPPVDAMWEQDDWLGECIVNGLAENSIKINGKGSMAIDLMQTSYSTVPSVDIELGNQCLIVDDESVNNMVAGIKKGINTFFEQ